MSDPAQENWAAFTRAWNGHLTYVKQAEKYNEFYLGEQWEEDARRQLDEEGRPVLTLNEIMQVINAVRGHYSRTRVDPSFRPARGGATADVAKTLTRVMDAIFDSNDYVERIEPQMFEDGIVEDRGFVDVRMDFVRNPLGEVALRSLNPRQVIIDPEATEYDPSTWKEVQVVRWLSLTDIEAYYGKAMRKKVESVATTPDNTLGDNSVKFESFDQNGSITPWNEGATDYRVRSVRVIERQHRRMGRAKELFDPHTGECRVVPTHWDDERTNRVAETYGYRIRHRAIPRIRWTVSADHVTLHDDWSPYEEFTVVPYFPMFRRGRPSGLARHLIDPQEQLNKIESQVLHTINTTANSGWTVEAGSLVNMSEADLERRGAESGLVLVYGRNRQAPEKITPNPMPSGLESYAQKAGHYVRNLVGAEALLGQQPKSSVSGVALGAAEDKALLGLQVVFDNLNYTRKLVVRRVLDCVQHYYTEHRVFTVTDWRNPDQPEAEVEINAVDAAGQAVNDVSVGTYDVRIDSTPTRATLEDHQFAQILELRKAGVMIPDHHVILASQLEGRREIAAQVKQMQGLGEPDEAQLKMQQLEMAKAEAEVALLQAQIMELEARAEHNAAKAESETVGTERDNFDVQARYQMEMARLKADLEKKRADIENKIDVARIHSDAKDGLTRYQKQMDAHQRGLDRELEVRKEGIKGAAGLQQEAMRDQMEIQKAQISAQNRARQGEPASSER